MHHAAGLEDMSDTPPGIKIVSIADGSGASGRGTALQVVLETLDDALVATRQFVEVENERRLLGLLRLVAPAAKRRAALLRRIMADDGVAVVDRLVEAAVDHAGSNVGAVIATLRSAPAGVKSIRRPGSPEVKAWLRDGRLLCSFEIGREIRWDSPRLIVRRRLFDIALTALEGRTLGSLFEHPMLPATIRIARCEHAEAETEILLRLATRVVHRSELG